MAFPDAVTIDDRAGIGRAQLEAIIRHWPIPDPEIYQHDSEAAFADHLQALVTTHQLDAWAYHPFRCRIGRDRFLIPDFVVILAGDLHAWEVTPQPGRSSLAAFAEVWPSIPLTVWRREGVGWVRARVGW